MPRPTDHEYATALGRLIAEKKRGLSQSELGKLAKISQPMMSRLEAGTGMVGPDTLRRLGAALGVDPAELQPKAPQVDRRPWPQILGERIRVARITAGLRPADLCEQAGLEQEELAEVERGELRLDANGAIIEAIGEALDIDMTAEFHDLSSSVDFPNGAVRHFMPLFPPVSDDQPDARHRIDQLWKFLSANADAMGINSREVYLLANTRFPLQDWMRLDKEFWSDLLKFWRRRDSRGTRSNSIVAEIVAAKNRQTEK